MPSPVAHERRRHLDDPLVDDTERRRLGREVGLVQHDDLRPLVEAGSVGGELVVDHGEALVGVALRSVDHVHEHARALEVREELVAEADALARPLDQPRHVGDGELPAVGPVDRAEHRAQRRERVVGDLRRRVRDPPQQRRLARVRQAGERRVGHQLEMQLELELAAGEAGLGEARRLARRRREAGVAAPAATAAWRRRAARRRGAGRRRVARRRGR